MFSIAADVVFVEAFAVAVKLSDDERVCESVGTSFGFVECLFRL